MYCTKLQGGKPVVGRGTKSESPFRSGSCDGTRRGAGGGGAGGGSGGVAGEARATLGAAAIQVFFWCSATASRSIRWHCHTIIVVDCVLLEAKPWFSHSTCRSVVKKSTISMLFLILFFSYSSA